MIPAGTCFLNVRKQKPLGHVSIVASTKLQGGAVTAAIGIQAHLLGDCS